MKQYHIQLERGDVGKTIFLPGDPGRSPIIAEHFDNARFVMRHREYVTYTGDHQGVKVSVTSTGVGCPSLAIAIEELIKVGGENFIRVGTGGILQEWVPPGSIIIVTAAVRGDGTSREYIPLEFPAVASLEVVEALIEGAEKRGIKPIVGIIRSHDAFYIESSLARVDYLAKDKPWIESNVLAVENESATLFTLAYMRGKKAGTILAVGGSHQHPEQSASEETMQKLISEATEIALYAAWKLGS